MTLSKLKFSAIGALCAIATQLYFAPAGAQTGPANETVKTPPEVAPAPETPANPPAVPVDTGLTDQMLYQYLISEIAGQRGRTGLAMRGLKDLAQKTRDPRLARRAVELAFQARDMAQALDATTLWLELEPNSPVAHQALNALGVSQGTLEAATANIASLLAQPGKAAGVLMQVNTLLARFADKQAVVVAVKELTAPYLSLPEAHFALTAAYFTARQYPPALAAADEAEKRREGWPQLAVLKAQVLRELSYERAAAYLADFLLHHPESNEVRLAYARMLVAQKAYLQAREQFRAAAKQEPEDMEIPYAIGLLSQQIDDFADADAQFRRVLELMPRDPNPVLFNLGTVAEARKKPDEAIDWYSRISAGDYFVTSRLKIAAIHTRRDGMAAGRKYLQDSQEDARDTPETYVQLILAEAQLLRDAKSHRDAYNLLTEAIQKMPDTADLLYDRAMVAEKIGKYDVMETDLRRVIELRPEHAHAYNALGYTFADRNERLDEAYELVQKALQLAPNDAFIQDSLGWVHYRRGRLDEAYVTLKAAYELRHDPEIAAHLGEVLWVRGKRDDAVALWKSSLLENPENEMLVTVMRRFKR